jgi:hypothetical protein
MSGSQGITSSLHAVLPSTKHWEFIFNPARSPHEPKLVGNLFGNPSKIACPQSQFNMIESASNSQSQGKSADCITVSNLGVVIFSYNQKYSKSCRANTESSLTDKILSLCIPDAAVSSDDQRS